VRICQKIEPSKETGTSVRSAEISESRRTALIIVIGIILSIVVYVIINSFSLIAFGFSLVIAIAIIYAQPELLRRLESQNSIQYYAVALTASFILSHEKCKGDDSFLITLLAAVGIMMLSMYIGCQEIFYISVFLNIYAVLNIGIMLINSPCRSSS
jgi:membrane protein YdbS with pleckstrin-like domain